MATGICYTQSGNVKKYESILGPKLGIYRGDDFGPITSDTFSLSLRPSDVMCIYTIMVKGDEYILSENNPTDYLVVKYGGVDKMFGYKKKSINQSKVYVSLSCSDDMVLNNVVYHPYNSTEQTIHTIDMSISGDDYIDIIIGLSSKYRGGSFSLFFKDGNGNIIQAKKYQGIMLVVDYDLSFPVDNTNSRCIISKYSNKLEEVGNIYADIDGLGYSFGSTGWSNNTLYTPNNWNIIGGAPGPSNMKIDHYQSSFKITLDGYTRTIWLTTKIETLFHL